MINNFTTLSSLIKHFYQIFSGMIMHDNNQNNTAISMLSETIVDWYNHLYIIDSVLWLNDFFFLKMPEVIWFAWWKWPLLWGAVVIAKFHAVLYKNMLLPKLYCCLFGNHLLYKCLNFSRVQDVRGNFCERHNFIIWQNKFFRSLKN